MPRTASDAQDTSGLVLELRRGVLVLAVLTKLHQAHYGYSLKRDLAAGGLPVDEGTLYPLLRRLESQGFLESSWRLAAAHPRRYYQLSPRGRAVLAALTAEWLSLTRAVEGILAGEETPVGSGQTGQPRPAR
jgi:PadR family transcriptional regulator PadR